MKKSLQFIAMFALLMAGGLVHANEACTAKLAKYERYLMKNVTDTNVSPRQRQASQDHLNKIARLRADKRNNDCVVFDKMFP